MHNRIAGSHFFFTCASHSPWFSSLPFLITFSIPSWVPLGCFSPFVLTFLQTFHINPQSIIQGICGTGRVGAILELHGGFAVDPCSFQFFPVKEEFSNSFSFSRLNFGVTSSDFSKVLSYPDTGLWKHNRDLYSTIKAFPKEWSTLGLLWSSRRAIFL